MASKFLGLLSIIALAGSGSAGIAATYGYNPYVATYHAPAASAAITYASHQPVYHQHPAAHPLVYHHAPAQYYARAAVVPAVAAPIARAVYAAPVLAKTHHLVAPVVTKAVVPTVAVAAPVVHAVPAVVKNVELESDARYDFSYGVHDSITGDIKSQVETRSGGNVVGSYSVVDADGYKRTVTYTADDLNGFNAVVQREPIVAKVAAVATSVVPTYPAAAAIPAVQQTVAFQHPHHHHHHHYLPQVPVAVQPPQEQHQPETIVVPDQPENEPTPIEYPEQSQQQQPEQSQYPQEQQFPPFPQFESPQVPNGQSGPDADDSDVIEARSSKNLESNGSTEQPQPSSTTAQSPAPVTENQDESEPAKQTA